MMRIMGAFNNNLLALIGLIMFCSSCKKGQDSKISVGEKTLLNISYGANAAQKMDVYLPGSRTPSTPVMFIIHGGSFYGGDKADFTFFTKRFVDRGYAVVNLNYRLVDTTGTSKFPPLHKASSVNIPQ